MSEKRYTWKRQLRLVPYDAESRIWYAKFECPHETDRQNDDRDPEDTEATLKSLKADIAAGRLLEMGVNHEGEPSPHLEALAVEIAKADVTIGDTEFHAGDTVIKFRASAGRQKALLAGRGRGVSLEGIEDKSVADGKAAKSELSTDIDGRAQLPLPGMDPMAVLPEEYDWTLTITKAKANG